MHAMNKVIQSLSIVLIFFTGLQATETSMERECRNLVSIQQENTYKMWQLKQFLSEKTLPNIPQDIEKIIGCKLHLLTRNAVLKGELIFTENDIKSAFKIEDLLNNGEIDLSNPIFKKANEKLRITTDPKKFLQIIKKDFKLIILIAPKFLIEENITSSASPFQLIISQWDEKIAPVGIFYRITDWTDTSWYKYEITTPMSSLSSKNLYEITITARENYPNSSTTARMDMLKIFEECNSCKNFIFTSI